GVVGRAGAEPPPALGQKRRDGLREKPATDELATRTDRRMLRVRSALAQRGPPQMRQRLNAPCHRTTWPAPSREPTRVRLTSATRTSTLPVPRSLPRVRAAIR